MSDLDLLIDKLKKTIPEYPNGMDKCFAEVKRFSFFPGGTGLFENATNIRNRRIMVLGQDWGDEKSFKRAKDNSNENPLGNATLGNLKRLIESVPELSMKECFLTNVIMGVRQGAKSMGESPAFVDADFLYHCNEFLKFQVNLQKPKVILVCGKHAAMFLAKFYQPCKVWGEKFIGFKKIDENKKQILWDVKVTPETKTHLVLLVHPCMRNRNAKFRIYKECRDAAEREMIRDAIKRI